MLPSLAIANTGNRSVGDSELARNLHCSLPIGTQSTNFDHITFLQFRAIVACASTLFANGDGIPLVFTRRHPSQVRVRVVRFVKVLVVNLRSALGIGNKGIGNKTVNERVPFCPVVSPNRMLPITPIGLERAQAVGCPFPPKPSKAANHQTVARVWPLDRLPFFNHPKVINKACRASKGIL